MQKRPPGGLFYPISLAAFFIVAAALFAAGISHVWSLLDSYQNHYNIVWQEISSALLLLAVLPTLFFGRHIPATASNVLFVYAGITVAQVCGITNRTGDGTGAGLVGLLAFLGLPCLLSGLLFRWRSLSQPSPTPRLFR